MADTDDIVIILGLLGLGLIIVKTPTLRASAIKYVAEPVAQRGKTALTFTSLPLIIFGSRPGSGVLGNPWRDNLE